MTLIPDENTEERRNKAPFKCGKKSDPEYEEIFKRSEKTIDQSEIELLSTKTNNKCIKPVHKVSYYKNFQVFIVVFLEV